VPLSPEGVREAIEAGERLKAYRVEYVFTSTLVRAMQTAMLSLVHAYPDRYPVVIHEEGRMAEWSKIYSEETREKIIPVFTNWELNERYYGELQGKNKKKTAEEFGDEQVRLWRRSYDIPPPGGEALKDTAERTIPFFKDKVVQYLELGNVMVSAHGNSLRSIVMYLDNLTPKEVLSLEIPTGVPIIYRYEEGRILREE
ncbi:MAG: histidine phosphatase family protein, partial [Thermoplasmata archaeon]|nr:histidine phosphatase family protein [Thermoplasmata archaeon]